MDSNRVAKYIGLVDGDALSTYTARFDDFPEPWIHLGRFIRLWLPWQIDDWLEAHPGIGRKRPDR
jgi:hypothetical protein